MSDEKQKPIVGNAAAMRKALNDIISIADREFNAFRETAAMKEMRDKCCAALAAPPRNCDVGTAEEQEERFMRHCELCYTPNDVGEDAGCCRCPAFNQPSACEFAWSQLPYEAEEGDKESPND